MVRRHIHDFAWMKSRSPVKAVEKSANFLCILVWIDKGTEIRSADYEADARSTTPCAGQIEFVIFIFVRYLPNEYVRLEWGF